MLLRILFLKKKCYGVYHSLNKHTLLTNVLKGDKMAILFLFFGFSGALCSCNQGPSYV